MIPLVSRRWQHMGFCYIRVIATFLFLGFFQLLWESFKYSQVPQWDVHLFSVVPLAGKSGGMYLSSSTTMAWQTLGRPLVMLHFPLWFQKRSAQKQVRCWQVLFVPIFYFSKLHLNLYLHGLKSGCVAESEKQSGRGRDEQQAVRRVTVIS